jgi:hypothetical protein
MTQADQPNTTNPSDVTLTRKGQPAGAEIDRPEPAAEPPGLKNEGSVELRVARC